MAEEAAHLPAERLEQRPGWLTRASAAFSGGRLGPRAASLIFALALEALLIALLFMIGWTWREETDMVETVTTFEAKDFSADEAEPDAPAQADTEPPASPVEPSLTEPVPQDVPVPETPLPVPNPLTNEPLPVPPVAPVPAPSTAPPKAAAPAGPPARTYGPPDTGSRSSRGDSQRVGTASNGEPLYAARWYREPTRQELAGYLSTADNPSTALIACRTVPDFYVDDCELIGESPQGSQIGRAVLAAAWQFRVRPARVGGRSQVGSWVRIRIDYTRQVRR